MSDEEEVECVEEVGEEEVQVFENDAEEKAFRSKSKILKEADKRERTEQRNQERAIKKYVATQQMKGGKTIGDVMIELAQMRENQGPRPDLELYLANFAIKHPEIDKVYRSYTEEERRISPGLPDKERKELRNRVRARIGLPMED